MLEGTPHNYYHTKCTNDTSSSNEDNGFIGVYVQELEIKFLTVHTVSANLIVKCKPQPQTSV